MNSEPFHKTSLMNKVYCECIYKNMSKNYYSYQNCVRVNLCVREIERVCVCVCVCEREIERKYVCV